MTTSALEWAIPLCAASASATAGVQLCRGGHGHSGALVATAAVGALHHAAAPLVGADPLVSVAVEAVLAALAIVAVLDVSRAHARGAWADVASSAGLAMATVAIVGFGLDAAAPAGRLSGYRGLALCHLAAASAAATTRWALGASGARPCALGSATLTWLGAMCAMTAAQGISWEFGAAAAAMIRVPTAAVQVYACLSLGACAERTRK